MNDARALVFPHMPPNIMYLVPGDVLALTITTVFGVG